MKYLVHFAVILLFASWADSCFAIKLLVNQSDRYQQESYYVGSGNWTHMTSTLYSSFGSGNVTVSTNPLDNAASLATYGAIWLDLRKFSSQLSAPEITNLQAFISQGNRVVMLGENSLWATWDNSILGLVGGGYTHFDSGIDGTVPEVSNQLTNGVSTVVWGDDGIATDKGIGTDGISLFSENVATLWGVDQNVLSILSVNAESDTYWPLQSNAKFFTNVASWLADPPSNNAQSVTEPLPDFLMSGGVLLLGFFRGVRNRKRSDDYAQIA